MWALLFSSQTGILFSTTFFRSSTAGDSTSAFTKRDPARQCNIHPEMSAAVVAVDTPYFGLSNRAGRVNIPDVPDGRYQLNVWYERSLPEELKSVSRMITISEAARSLETIKVIENANFSLEHKNKYGQEYIPPANTGPAYGRP
jgi:hypothetical protein